MNVDRNWTDEELNGDTVSKKDLVTFLHEHATATFQQEHKIRGQLKNVAKTRTKDDLILAYQQLFETKAFKAEGEDEAEAAKKDAAGAIEDITKKTKKMSVEEEGPPKYKKRVLKKGDKVNMPAVGDVVAVFYKGMLEDGKVFDSNIQTGRNAKKAQPLKFKVGLKKVILGWDKVLMTMYTGEKCEVVIEAEWAYGRKGLVTPEGEVIIPRNHNLTFEIELVGINA